MTLANFSYTQHQQKLEILYFLDKLSGEIETDQLWRSFSSMDLISYVDLMEFLSFLSSGKMIDVVTDDTLKYYRITQKGRNILKEFTVDIGKSVREKIDQYISENKKQYQKERDFIADVVQNDNIYYVLFRMFFEHKIVFEMKLSFKTRSSALKAAELWRRDGAAVYSDIFDMFV